MQKPTVAVHQTTDTQLVPKKQQLRETPPPAFTAGHDVIPYGMSLRPAGVSCPGHVPSQPPVHPSPLTGRATGEAGKSLMLCKHCSQQLTHPCVVIETVLVTSPKHSTIQAAMKKINSVPAKTSTPSQATTKCGNRMSRNILGWFCQWCTVELQGRLSSRDLLTFAALRPPHICGLSQEF